MTQTPLDKIFQSHRSGALVFPIFGATFLLAGPAPSTDVGRRTPLDVYGPHGLRAMTDAIYEAWREDIDVRTNGLEHLEPGGYRVHVHEIAPGVVFDSGGVRLTAIPVLHGSWKQAFGYRIDTRDRSIVISGDTRPAPSMEKATAGVDMLIHEVHPESTPGLPNQNAEEWRRYLREFHTSDVELGKLAAATKPTMLVRQERTADAIEIVEVMVGRK